jgi:hypothetical protein
MTPINTSSSLSMFSSLPTEMCAYILSFLPFKDLAHLKEVNKNTNHFVTTFFSTICQFKLQQPSLSFPDISMYSKALLRFTNKPEEKVEKTKAKIAIVQMASQHLDALHLADGCGYLVGDKDFQGIDFSNDSSSDEETSSKFLEVIPNIQSLTFSWCKSANVIARINQYTTNLTLLNLIIGDDILRRPVSPILIDKHIKSIVSTHPKLSEVNLKGHFKLSDASIEHLSTLPKLTVLSLHGRLTLTDAGILKLASITSLAKLSLGFRFSLQVSEQELQAFKQLPHLTQLTQLSLRGLKYSKIADFVSKCAFLKKLSLDSCDLTDEKVESLSSLNKLETLNIKGNGKLTDLALISITSSQNLRKIKIGKQFSRAAVKALQAQFPGLKITPFRYS